MWAQTHVFVINFVVCIKLASVFNKLVSHSYAKFSIKNQLYYSFYLIRVSSKFKKKGVKNYIYWDARNIYQKHGTNEAVLERGIVETSASILVLGIYVASLFDEQLERIAEQQLLIQVVVVFGENVRLYQQMHRRWFHVTPHVRIWPLFDMKSNLSPFVKRFSKLNRLVLTDFDFFYEELAYLGAVVFGRQMQQGVLACLLLVVAHLLLVLIALCLPLQLLQ